MINELTVFARFGLRLREFEVQNLPTAHFTVTCCAGGTPQYHRRESLSIYFSTFISRHLFLDIEIIEEPKIQLL